MYTWNSTDIEQVDSYKYLRTIIEDEKIAKNFANYVDNEDELTFHWFLKLN